MTKLIHSRGAFNEEQEYKEKNRKDDIVSDNRRIGDDLNLLFYFLNFYPKLLVWNYSSNDD